MNKQQDLIYGIHAVQAALQQQLERINQLLVLTNRQDRALQAILTEAKQTGIRVQQVTRQELDTLIGHTHHQGVVAKIYVNEALTEQDLPQLLTNIHGAPLLLVLDEVQDPHNLGACLRSADAAGVHLVIAPKDNAVGLTAIVRKVACGAAESIPFIQVTNLARTLRELKQQGIWLYGLAGEASQSLYQTDLTGPAALVLGAEGSGLRKLTKAQCDELLYIPMAATAIVNSLNVSVATGIALFEVNRQRQLR